MILVVDTNIVFAALLKKSTSRKLLLEPVANYYAPEHLKKEILSYKEELRERTGLSKEEFELLFALVTENIVFVKKEKYEMNMTLAENLIGKIDGGDIPFLALALTLDTHAIWTENIRHFEKQSLVKVWRTKDVLNFL
ncbi:MAG: PIN domain-containing protein [bacterium]|nr:PIN domain-containing protein [bacterium]